MQTVVDADDAGKMTIGDDLINEWSHEPGSLKFRLVSSNFIFTFSHSEKEFILRVSHESRRSRSLLEAELNFMKHLRKSGLKIPKVIKSNRGVETIEKNTSNGTFFAIVFEAIKGKYIKHTQMNKSEIYEWGRQMALVHKASRKYNQQHNSQRYNFQEEINRELPYLNNDSKLQQLLNEIAAWLEALPRSIVTYGLIHYDLEEDNLLWEEDRTQGPYIIDFDDSAYHFYLADIAFAMEEIRELPPNDAIHFLQQFLAGYTSIHEIPEVTDWKKEFKLFNLLMDLMKTARTIRAYDSTDPNTDPEWLANMRKRHMESIEDQRNKFNNELSSFEKYCQSLSWVDLVDI